MNDIIATYEATQTGLSQDILTYGLLTIGLVIALILGSRRKVAYEQVKYKNLLLMLGFFVAMISASATFFSWLTTVKLTPVVMRTQDMDTPYGTVAYDDIRNAYFHQDNQKSRLAPDRVVSKTQFLIIDEISKKSHALSQENYDIDAIFATIKKQTGQ